jgi:tRNA(Ile)-lysidine synthase
VLRYLSDLAQPYRTDPTNLVGKYARNRVRLEVLPILEELHPGAAANLARAASLAREDLEALEALADAALETRGAEMVLPCRTLLSLPPALRRHAVRRAYAGALPGAPPPCSRHVESVLALAGAGPGTRSLDLPGGVVAVGRGGEEISLYVPGEVPSGEEALREGEVAFGGWIFRVEEVGRYDGREAALPGVAYLDGDGGPYRVRTAREGDMIRPLGLGGRKKVFRAMMDRKVPRDLRRRTPVVVSQTGEVAWIPFGELGEDFRAKGDEGRVLKVEVARRP